MDNKMKLNVMMELKNKGFDKSDIIAMVNDGKVFYDGAMDVIDGLIAMEYGKAEIADMVMHSNLIEAPNPVVSQPVATPVATPVVNVPKKGTGRKSKYDWILKPDGSSPYDEDKYYEKAKELGYAYQKADGTWKVKKEYRVAVYKTLGWIK